MTKTVSETTMFTRGEGNTQVSTLTVTLVHDPSDLPDVVKMYCDVGDLILKSAKTVVVSDEIPTTIADVGATPTTDNIEKIKSYKQEIKKNGSEWSEFERKLVIEAKTNKDAIAEYRRAFPKSTRNDSSLLIMRGKLQRAIGTKSKKK